MPREVSNGLARTIAQWQPPGDLPAPAGPIESPELPAEEPPGAPPEFPEPSPAEPSTEPPGAPPLRDTRLRAAA